MEHQNQVFQAHHKYQQPKLTYKEIIFVIWRT